jgi:acetyltransferase-like isoleucine patch superfamily enzyme
MWRSLAIFLYRHSLYRWLMRRRFPTARFDPSVEWRGTGKVEVGSDVVLGPNTVVMVGANCHLQLESGVWLGRDCEVEAGTMMRIGPGASLQHRTQLHGDVSIGAGCVGAANLYVSSSVHAFRDRPPLPIRLQDFDRLRASSATRSRPVSIGDDCWLGINVFVAPGVTIGRGCVVGANSVVTHDLAPYSIAVGSPARVIGQRLTFQPPRAIRADEDAHLPYFYAGFRQFCDSQPGEVYRRRGGLVANSPFTLAVGTTSGEGIEMDIDASTAGRLRHGLRSHDVPAGRSTARFVAVPNEDGFFEFDHDCVAADALVITTVRVVAPV